MRVSRSRASLFFGSCVSSPHQHGRCDAGSARIYSVRSFVCLFLCSCSLDLFLFGCADSRRTHSRNTRDVTWVGGRPCVCVLCLLSVVLLYTVSLLGSLSFAFFFFFESNRIESHCLFFSIFILLCPERNPLVVCGDFICYQSINI